MKDDMREDKDKRDYTESDDIPQISESLGKNSGKKPAKKKAKTSDIVISVILVIAIVVCAVQLVRIVTGAYKADTLQTTTELTTEVVQTVATTEEISLEEEMEAFEPTEDETYKDELLGIDIPEKDIDWADLWSQNEDIYAWIYIPNTAVDYPVLQHPTEDNYYLDHNVDGSYGYPGCVYSQLCTSKDFTDPVTLFYAHDMKNGTYFHTLHFFEDEDFFNENQYIFVYTPEHTYVYQIFATKVFSDVLIPMNYNYFTETDAFQTYLEDLQRSEYGDDYVRDGVEVTTDSHVLTLSTCISTMPNNRWLVNGVLLNESELPQ
jgi:sortase B